MGNEWPELPVGNCHEIMERETKIVVVKKFNTIIEVLKLK
jgi:hypothetical protein